MRILDGGLSQELFDIAKTIGGKSNQAADSLDTTYRAFLYLEKLCDAKLKLYPTTLQVRLLTFARVMGNFPGLR